MADLAAILAGAKGAKPAATVELEPDASSDDSEQGYGDELATLLGVTDQDKEAFNTALSGFIRQCKAAPSKPKAG